MSAMKKMLTLAITLSLISKSTFAQGSEIKAMVDQIDYLFADTLDCHADFYWKIIAQGESALPYLIEKLTDTTPTNARFHCKKNKLNVGEVAYFAIKEIGDFPESLVTNMQFDIRHSDQHGNLCWSFYDFLFYNPNKAIYQQKVKLWYKEHKSKYKSKAIQPEFLTDCQKKFKVKSFLYYEN
jgi:hypothetical protein